MSARSEWRQGWTVVLASAFGIAMGVAPTYTLGAFMRPLQMEFGWNRAELAGAMAMITVVSGIAIPFAGRAVDRFGARRLALTGCLVTGAAIASLSLINTSIVIYLALWGFVGLGMGLAAYLPWTRGIVGYFSESRGLAIAMAMCGASVSGVITPLLSTFFIAQFGWRTAYLGVAGTLLIVVFPVAWSLFREAPRAAPATSMRAIGRAQTITDSDFTVQQALRSYQFWLMAVSFLLAGGSLVSVGVHLIPLLIDRGLSPMQAAGAMSVMSVAALTGRLSSGYLLDRMPAPLLVAITFSFAVAACVVLSLGAVSDVWLYIAAACFGIPIGASPALIPFLAARCFGLTNYGMIYGLLGATFNIGGATMPPLLGWLYERDHNYQSAIIVIAAGQILSAVSLQFLGQYRKSVAPQPVADPVS